MYYKIIGDKCPFGTRKMVDGVMDDSMFGSNRDEDYRAEKECGSLAIRVAQQYGAKPCCEIECAVGTIVVYSVDRCFAAYLESPSGWRTQTDAMWRNTVGPLAIVDHFTKLAHRFAREMEGK